MRRDTLLMRLARVAQPGRPLLRIRLPPRLARFLIAGGAQAASDDSMTVNYADVNVRNADCAKAGDPLPVDRSFRREADPIGRDEGVSAQNADLAIITASPSQRLAVRRTLLPLAVVTSNFIVRLIELAVKFDSDSADTRAHADALAFDRDRAPDFVYSFASDCYLDFDLFVVSARDHDIDDPDDLGVVDALISACYRDLDVTKAMDRALAIAADRVRFLDRTVALDSHVVRLLNRGIIRARTLAGARTRDLTRGIKRPYEPRARVRDPELARDLERIRARAWARTRNLDHVLDRALASARALDRTCAGEMSRLLGFDLVEGIAVTLLNGSLDDFTQVDLSNVDLADVDLTGVRWSRTTRWAPDIYEEVLRRSRETTRGSGIYVIYPPDYDHEDAEHQSVR